MPRYRSAFTITETGVHVRTKTSVYLAPNTCICFCILSTDGLGTTKHLNSTFFEIAFLHILLRVRAPEKEPKAKARKDRNMKTIGTMKGIGGAIAAGTIFAGISICPALQANIARESTPAITEEICISKTAIQANIAREIDSTINLSILGIIN